MNIPQRARELADMWVATLEAHASFGEDAKASRIGDAMVLILAFAAEVERDALERAVSALDKHIAPTGTEQSDYYTDLSAGFSGARDAIRALITTPTPERPDPTVALALLFQNLFHNWSDKTETAMIAAGLLSEEDAEPTALGHEALRIAKENDHG